MSSLIEKDEEKKLASAAAAMNDGEMSKLTEKIEQTMQFHSLDFDVDEAVGSAEPDPSLDQAAAAPVGGGGTPEAVGAAAIENPVELKLNEEEADRVVDYFGIMREDYECNDTRIAMIGNVDSGKSTLIGVLTNAALDDGRGSARSLVLKHRHEQENGRTSAVTVEIMGYKGEEQVLPTARNHAQRWAEVMEKSDHSVTLIDLCGHEKYLKTTLFGLTGLMPDYALLVVGSNMGVQVMTREHISIACALNIPMFVAVTKVSHDCTKSTKMDQRLTEPMPSPMALIGPLRLISALQISSRPLERPWQSFLEPTGKCLSQ